MEVEEQSLDGVIDARSFPLVVVTFPAIPAAEGVRSYSDALLRLFRTRGAFVAVADIDGVDASSVSAPLRRLVAQCADQLARQGALIAEAVIASSSIRRGIFTAYTWFRDERPYPIRCFPTRPEAMAWAQEQLRTHQQQVSGELPQQRASTAPPPTSGFSAPPRSGSAVPPRSGSAAPRGGSVAPPRSGSAAPPPKSASSLSTAAGLAGKRGPVKPSDP